MMRAAWSTGVLLTLIVACAGGGSGSTDATPGAVVGSPKLPSVVDGYFDNGVFSGFVRPWLLRTTAASSVAFDCDGDASCAGNGRICARVVLEGSALSDPFGMPSFAESASSVPQAGFSLALHQGPSPDPAAKPWSPVGDGLYIAFTEAAQQRFIVELSEGDPGSTGGSTSTSERWCAFQPASPSPDLTLRWQDFQRCNASGVQYFSPTRPIRNITVYFEPHGQTATEHRLCLLDMVPFGLPSNPISCVDWYRHSIPGTPYVLINNVWNAQHAKGAPYTQCLRRRTTPSGDQFGWTWRWPDIDMDTSTSYAAPEVLFGRKPWDGGASTTPDLPKRIDALRGLALDYAVEIMAGQSYNLNATLWLTRTAAAPSAPDPDEIVAEVMVRFNNPLGIGGGTVDDGRVVLGGIPFQVSHQDAHADASGGSTQTWTMVVYETQLPRLADTFDVALVLQDLLAKGLAQPENGVQGVELITEVSGGTGEVWLNRFDVAVD